MSDPAYHSQVHRTHNARIAVMTSRASVEWYTPAHIIRRVRAVMGAIDLDPASCEEANRTVQARRIYTAREDGLLQSWQAPTLYLNPPYGKAIDPFIHRLDHDYRSGIVGEALALVPARVDTRWWQRLVDYPVCLVEGRITFSNAKNGAAFPCGIFYLGGREDRFVEEFSGLGAIWRCVSRPAGATQLLLGAAE